MIWVGFLNHENYKEFYYSKNSREIQQTCEYYVGWKDEFFIISSNDEEIIITYSGKTLEDIIHQINEEDWGTETPNNFTKDSLFEYIRNTQYDKDSSNGWILFENGDPIVYSKYADIYYLDN